MERFEGCLVGVAVGDALGQPIEFLPEIENADNYPNADKIRKFRTKLQIDYGGILTEMIKSPLRVFKAGEYTDDTDQTLALTDSLIEKGLDPADFAQRLVVWFDNLGEKGCGRITRKVIGLLKQGMSWEEASLQILQEGARPANGSLMRTAPVGLYFRENPDKIDEAAEKISWVTHAHPYSILACQIASQFVGRLALGVDRQEALDFVQQRYTREFQRVMDSDISQHKGDAIVTLHISIDSFMTTESFEEAIVKAVNTKGDADSYGAVTGAFAGTYYGLEQIPLRWRLKLNPLSYSQIAQKGFNLYHASLADPDNK